MSLPFEDAFDAYRARPSEAALLELLKSCQPTIFRICSQLLDHAEDAEDAMQGVLMQVVGMAGRAPHRDAFRSWLYRSCLCRSLDLRRKYVRRRLHETRTDMMNRPGPTLDEDTREALFVAMERLEDQDRVILIEHYFDRSSLSTLAARYRLTKVSIWKRLERARDRLRAQLAGLVAIPAAIDLDALNPAPEPPFALGPEVLERVREATEVGLAAAAAPAKGLGLAATLLLGATLAVAGFGGGFAVRSSMVPRALEPVACAEEHTPVAEVNLLSMDSAPTGAPVSTPLPKAPAFLTPDRRRFLAAWLVGLREQRLEAKYETIRQLDIASPGLIPKGALLRPSESPSIYADLVLALHEVGMEILGAPFSALQLESARDLRNSLQAALERGAPLGGTERRIAEIEADAAFARGMAVLMPQDVDHRNLLIDIDMALRRGSRKSLPDPLFVKVVVEDWTEAMAADASQRPYLETAAELFRQGLQRITEEFRDSTREAYDESEFVKSMVSSKPFLGEPYSVAARLDYQAKSQRLQWSILSTLLPLLSPDQQDRVKNRLEFNYHWGTDSVVIELR